MLEQITNLYQELNRIAVEYMVLQKKNNITEIEKIMPQIQEFVLWFLGGNIFELDDIFYEELSQNLLGILSDMNLAMQQKDRVLMHDAVNYGLVLYLEMFLSDQNGENQQ